LNAITDKVTVPTTVEFVDIAGLVKGASKGEGLGNQFLTHIKQVNAICHILRCFEDEKIVHVGGKVDPIADKEIIDMELCLADLDVVEKNLTKNEKLLKSGDKTIPVKVAALKKIKPLLEQGKSARHADLTDDEKLLVQDLHLMTIKPVLYVCNVNESDVVNGNDMVRKVEEVAKAEGAKVVVVSARIESEIAEMTEEEQKTFLEELGLKESGLNRMIRGGYELLNLITYFTAGEKETRAWTITKGTKAPGAAGVIHTDFEKGFIRAEIYHCDALFELKSENAVKEKGLLRLEGKDYVMKDGDVAHFRFNV